MSEESTTPDLGEGVSGLVEALNRRAFDAVASFYRPDVVFDMSPAGLGIFEGRDVVRSVNEDWLGAYEEFRMATEGLVDLGNGVGYAVMIQNARLAGSTGVVRQRDSWVCDFVEGLFVRITHYPDIDEGRAAAERLARERG